MKTSLAVLALIGAVKCIQIENEAGAQVDAALYEQNRYFNSNGEAIILAETEGHARIEMTKIEKYTSPKPIDSLNLMIESYNCKAEGKSTETDKNSGIDEITHCPINQKGPVEAHMQQINLADNAYVSEFYVGNPPQKMRGLFDTGSTNTWLLNKNTDIGGASKEFSYDDTKSTSAKKLEQRAAIQFGSGALMGHFMTDDLRLGSCDGEKSSGQIHIKNQKFGNVEKQKTIFTGNNFEAIIGMAYPALAEKDVKPVFDEMIDQKLLKSNIFAYYFTTAQAEEKGLKSDMTFGYYDKSKFKGEMTWHQVDYKYMFGVKLDDIKVGGKNLEMCKGRADGCLITFDSGTSLMSFPTWGAEKMMQAKLPTANFVVPCTSHTQFGDMTLVIGGKDYTLSNEEWMFPSQEVKLSQAGEFQKTTFSMGPLGPQLMAQVDSSAMMDLDGFKPKAEMAIQTESESERKQKYHGKHACASTVMAMDISKDQFLVGDIFMRKYYTVFDRDNDKVGLAEANTTDKLKALTQTKDEKKK